MPRNRGKTLSPPHQSDVCNCSINSYRKKARHQLAPNQLPIALLFLIAVILGGRIADCTKTSSVKNEFMRRVFNEAPLSSQRTSVQSRTCWVGREVSASFDRSSEPPSRAFITICPSLKVQCRGRISSWRTTLTIADTNPINFAIFRSTHDSSGQRFSMVGYNTFTPSSLGRTVFEVPTAKQLDVLPGDIFGYFRMGIGQSEFIGYVNVDSENSTVTNSQSRSGFISGSYDSCYLLPQTYIDLIKANYKITIDSNAKLQRRLLSLAAVVESVIEDDKSPSSNFGSVGRVKTPRGLAAMTTESSSSSSAVARNRVKSAGDRAIQFDSAPPAPVLPMIRWRHHENAPQPVVDQPDDENFAPDLTILMARQQSSSSDNEEPAVAPAAHTNSRASAQALFNFVSESQRHARINNNNRTRDLRMRAAASSAAPQNDDQGLQWCGEPPSVENAYSVNDAVANIRLPARAYTCLPNYSPAGYNRIYCDPSAQKWTPLTFQCIYTIVVDDNPKNSGLIPRTVPIVPGMTAPATPVTVGPTQKSIGPAPGSQSSGASSTLCMFPPVIDNGYAIRQDDTSVVYRCYPGFLKIGQVDQDNSLCDKSQNSWSAPKVSCVSGRQTATEKTRPSYIPVAPPVAEPPPVPRPPPLAPVATVTIPIVDNVTPSRPIIIGSAPSVFIQPIPSVQQVIPPTPRPAPSGFECGPPPKIANGRYYLDQNPIYPAKSYIYECYDGYVMRGQPVVFCNPYYGTFTQLTARCDPVGLEATSPKAATQRSTESPPDCGTPPPIINAFTVTGGKSSTAVYLCVPGYTGVGIAEIQCVKQDHFEDPGRGPTWSKTMFKCVPSSQITQPTPITTTTTTTPATTEFQPFLIIPGRQRTPPTSTTTTTTTTTTPPTTTTARAPPPTMPASVVWRPMIGEVVVTQPPFPEPATLGRPPPISPNSVQLITPSVLTRPVLSNWQDVQTLQPTMNTARNLFNPPTPQTIPPATATTTKPQSFTDNAVWLQAPQAPESNQGGVCQVFQTCGDPPTVAHAKTEPSYSGRHSCPGDYVRYVCQDGYRLDSLISAVFCSEALSYSWSPQRPPICTPKK